MALKSFLKYVEIQTKTASIIPFLLGSLYSVQRYNSFQPVIFIIMLISLISFDMATTAINNYIGYKKSHKAEVGKHEPIKNNVLAAYKIKESTAIFIIFTLLFIAILFGLLLTLKTNLIILIIGIVSFLVGILYTYGPIPICSTPLGEIFSGFFMGFLIMFLSIYTQNYDKNIITLTYNNGVVDLYINLLELFYILLIAIPVMGGIANIMLANNICDVEEDFRNSRFTLPYYLGKKNSLRLFKALYYIGYLDIIILVITGLAPVYLLVSLITFFPVSRGIKKFYKKQIKRETFVLSVKNFILMNGCQIIIMSVLIFFKSLKG